MCPLEARTSPAPGGGSRSGPLSDGAAIPGSRQRYRCGKSGPEMPSAAFRKAPRERWNEHRQSGTSLFPPSECTFAEPCISASLPTPGRTGRVSLISGSCQCPSRSRTIGWPSQECLRKGRGDEDVEEDVELHSALGDVEDVFALPTHFGGCPLFLLDGEGMAATSDAQDVASHSGPSLCIAGSRSPGAAIRARPGFR